MIFAILKQLFVRTFWFQQKRVPENAYSRVCRNETGNCCSVFFLYWPVLSPLWLIKWNIQAVGFTYFDNTRDYQKFLHPNEYSFCVVEAYISNYSEQCRFIFSFYFHLTPFTVFYDIDVPLFILVVLQTSPVISSILPYT